jgi:hypothetical protein
MTKATFTVGGFGLAARKDCFGKVRINVNVRTDQKRQKKLAGLPANSKVKIIDAPGGGVNFEEFPEPTEADLFKVLRREISEETDGCRIDSVGEFRGPLIAITNNADESKPSGDMAFWMPIKIHGDPRPSNEALEHPWISLEQLNHEDEYRCVGKLGKAGRTGRMIRAAFDFYETNMSHDELFSYGEFEWTKIEMPSGPVEYVLRSGNPVCDHVYSPVSSYENYSGQCRLCKKCGRVETYPAPGEYSEFYGMSGKYVVESNGSPGLSAPD